MSQGIYQSRSVVSTSKTPVLRYSEEPDSSRDQPGSSEHPRDRRLSDRSSFIIHRSSFPRAYTLIEVLIVAVVVVLMLGMALPVFHAITGSRSEAGASNLIASMLGRARTDAIGLQRVIGVAFLYNPSSQLSYMAEVGVADAPSATQGLIVPPLGYCSFTNVTLTGSSVYYYINPSSTAISITGTPVAGSAPLGMASVGGPPVEMLPDTELLPLPSGVGVQTVCNAYFNTAGVRQTDAYLNFGVILFDGHGRIVSQNYGVSQYSKLCTSGNLKADFPTVGITNPYSTVDPLYFGVPSQYGVVVFQREAFVSQNFPTADPYYTTTLNNQSQAYTSGTPSQKAEEAWLDQNATPLLLNRYTGTLIKAE